MRYLKDIVKISKRSAFCYFLLTSTLVSGCFARPELDTSLLTHNPCAPPCWNNIIPGDSDVDDINAELENSPFVKKGSLHYSLTGPNGLPLAVSWQARSNKYRNRINFRKGKALLIDIWLDYDLTLGEVVEKYGPPESIYAYISRSGHIEYHIAFDYPAQGLAFSVVRVLPFTDDPLFEDGMGDLSSDMKVSGVFYFAPTSLEDMLTEAFRLSSNSVNDRLENSQEWQGFRPIKLAE